MLKLGKKFLTLWVAQFISLLGTHMCAFALGLKIFEQTHSVFIYSFFPLLAILPEIILAPILGVFIDRWNRKKAMIIGHSGAGLCIILIMFQIFAGNYNLYVIFPLIAISSIFNGLIFPAFVATTSQIVPESKLSIASAMLQFMFALVFIVGPSLAGSLLIYLGLKFIFIIDVISFLLAIMIITATKIEHITNGEIKKNSLIALKNEMVESIIYIKKEPILIFALLISGVANFNVGIINVLITPLVLGLANSSTLGIIFSIAGLGLLLGSFALMIYSEIKARLKFLLILGILQGVVFLLVFFNASLIILGMGTFLFMACAGLIGGLDMAIWQLKVPRAMQGRVFSFRTLVLGSMMLMGFLLSGFLTENVLLPLIKQRTVITNLICRLIGNSPYPEIEVLLFTLGIGTIMYTIFILLIVKYHYKNILIKDN